MQKNNSSMGHIITLTMNKLMQIRWPKNALCQVWLKLAPWFWRKFEKVINIFSLFQYYLPLEKEENLHSEIKYGYTCSGPLVLKKVFSMHWCFLTICHHLGLKKVWLLIIWWNVVNLHYFAIISPWSCFEQTGVWLKLTIQWFSEATKTIHNAHILIRKAHLSLNSVQGSWKKLKLKKAVQT